MSVKPLKAQVRQHSKRAIIDLAGDVDGTSEEVLNTAYTEADRQVPEAILLNFAEVEYINSTGIALIVGLLAKARQTHREMQVCGLSDHYLEIFQITRLSDFMTIFSDETNALANSSETM